MGVVVNLAVLACVLRATTKKVVNFFEEKVHPTRENPSYAYDSTVRRYICVYLCVFCVCFHTAYLLYYCNTVGLKPNP